MNYKIGLKSVVKFSYFSKDTNLILRSGNKNYDLGFLEQFDYCESENTNDYNVLPLHFKVKINYKNEFDSIIDSYFSLLDNKENTFVFQRGDYHFKNDSLNKFIVLKHSCLSNCSSFSLPYNVDYKINKTKEINECNFEVSFTGSFDSHVSRKKIPFIVEHMGKKSFVKKTDFYCNIVDENLKKDMMIQYNEILNDSVFVLCPPGHGVNSIRFFETMKIGRIPILFNKIAKLPFDWIINYDDFVLYYNEKEKLIDQINNYKDSHDINKISIKIKKYYDEILFWNPYKHLNLIIDHINL